MLADTGPLYALADHDDGLHARARRERDLLEGDELFSLAAAPVLIEGYNLVLHRLGMAPAQTWLAELAAGAGLINPTIDDYLAAASRVGRYADQAMSLTDGVLAELSDRLSMPVWTFDHHFDVMGVDVWRA